MACGDPIFGKQARWTIRSDRDDGEYAQGLESAQILLFAHSDH